MAKNFSEELNKNSDQTTEQSAILYISGPISGYPNLNRVAFQEAAERLIAQGYQVVNPLDVVPAGADWHTAMRYDIAALLRCEGVATLAGWPRSRGARIEVQLAGRLDMPVRAVEEWLREAESAL